MLSLHPASETLTVRGQQELCGVFLWQPADLVDLLLDLQTLQVVELGLVALKSAVNIVLPSSVWLVLTLKKTKDRGYTVRGI